MDLNKLISDLEEIDKVDVMKNCVESKLNASLAAYVDSLNMSCKKILEQDCLSVVKKIVNKYAGMENVE